MEIEERESINQLIKIILHSLLDKNVDGTENLQDMPTEHIFLSIDALEKLYRIQELLNNRQK